MPDDAADGTLTAFAGVRAEASVEAAVGDAADFAADGTLRATAGVRAPEDFTSDGMLLAADGANAVAGTPADFTAGCMLAASGAADPPAGAATAFTAAGALGAEGATAPAGETAAVGAGDTAFPGSADVSPARGATAGVVVLELARFEAGSGGGTVCPRGLALALSSTAPLTCIACAVSLVAGLSGALVATETFGDTTGEAAPAAPPVSCTPLGTTRLSVCSGGCARAAASGTFAALGGVCSLGATLTAGTGACPAALPGSLSPRTPALWFAAFSGGRTIAGGAFADTAAFATPSGVAAGARP